MSASSNNEEMAESLAPSDAMMETTPLSVDAELARLEELENQLTCMKVRCDSDSILSCADSTTSTQSLGSSSSSPLNDITHSTPGSPRTPIRESKARQQLERVPSAIPIDAGAAQRFGVTRPIVGIRRANSTLELGGAKAYTTMSSSGGSNSSVESVGKSKKLSSVETRRAYAQSVKARMSGSNGNVEDGVIHRTVPAASAAARKASLTRTQSQTTLTSSSSSMSGAAVAVGSASAAAVGSELITPSILLTPPRRRRDSIASNSSSVSSVASVASTPSNSSSIVSNASARSLSATGGAATSSSTKTPSSASAATSSSSSRLSRTRSTTALTATASSSSASSSKTTASSARATTTTTTTSSAATATTRSSSGRASPAKTSSSGGANAATGGIPPPRVSVMHKLLMASKEHIKDARVDAVLVKQLKQQYVLAEQGVQQLLRPSSSSSSNSGAMPPSPVRGGAGGEMEVRRLKGGMKTLSEHSVALMLACEVLQRQQDDHFDEMAQLRVMNDQLMHQVESLSVAVASSSSNSNNEATATATAEDDHAATAAQEFDRLASQPVEDNDDTEDRDATAPPRASPLSPPPAPPLAAQLERRFSNSSLSGASGASDTSLSAFVHEMLRTATEKIEEKWKLRFAEKLAEHETALQTERERASVSMMTTSKLVTDTKHEKDDAFKALRDENVAFQLKTKQNDIEMASLQYELNFLKEQLHVQDEIRNSSSFWEKTTDLAKQNRALTEDLAIANANIKKLQEVLIDHKTQLDHVKQENENCVQKTKTLELEKQVFHDKIIQVETKFDDEKSRREQFQVNVEQLTVENTALYAQMVALQATHEAKMEEQKVNFEKRNVVVAAEMRALHAQNRLLLRSGGSGASGAASGSSNGSMAPLVASVPLSSMGAATEQDDKKLQQVTDELLSVRQELLIKTDQIDELEKQLYESLVIRKQLHNTIQELRGNIRVHVRLRPFLKSDGAEAQADSPQSAVKCDSFGGTITTKNEEKRQFYTFAFDKVYGQSETQESVFKDVSDFIQSAMDGYNVCLFAYGQTGSGKTHTMQGSGKNQLRGMIPRAFQLIIATCRELSLRGWVYTLEATFFEIYNETIRDLLTSSSSTNRQNYQENEGKKFTIRTDKRGKNYVEGLTKVEINFQVAERQLDEIVNLAACNRSVDKTDMNAHSSRSHSIFGLQIRGVNEAQNTEVHGSLSLVDLAGSERLSRSNATGDRLKEAQFINKSLSSLADVFQALAKKAAHVPYRNSKLTYALQPALSGDGKTLMMVNLSPTVGSVDESVCSLRFAQNVSQCELGAPTRQIKSRAETTTTMTPASSNGNGNGSSGSNSAMAGTGSNTGTPTTSSRPRALTAVATPPIAKRLQF